MKPIIRLIWLLMHLHLANHALHHYTPVLEDDRRAEIKMVKHHKPKRKEHELVGTK